jgi:hypothetical protein
MSLGWMTAVAALQTREDFRERRVKVSAAARTAVVSGRVSVDDHYAKDGASVFHSGLAL